MKNREVNSLKSIKLSKNYLMLQPEELLIKGIYGTRLRMALILRSKWVDILSIILIALYSLLMIIYLGFDEQLVGANVILAFNSIELALLGFFCIEIVLNIYSFGYLYVFDPWNIFDMFIIILCLTFVFMSMFIVNQQLQNFLKIRGIFRLLRIFLLVRKLNALRILREVDKKRNDSQSTLEYDIRSPLERVLQILGQIKD